ncbi:hypothetical protein WAI453_008170 [Rhynchosporium graminicola]
MSWVKEISSKGYLWATPGPYLRKTLLLALARRVSDAYEPEAFYLENSFGDLPYAKVSADDEAVYARTLAETLVLSAENEEEEDYEQDY